MIPVPPPLPRWFWLLPILAIAAWWPLQPWWQSDDFLAVHYVQHGRHVLADFTGPQYGATDLWAFYRPLITASFWLDQQFGGVWPPLSHASNVLAHGVNALLVGCLWRRFLPVDAAFFAGLLWALLPSHQGSIAWAVGRVDSHTTVWCLLTVLLALRAHERLAAGERSRRWPLLLTTAAALASKESALMLPLLATFAVALRATGPLGVRLQRALATTGTAWLVLLVYLPLRFVLLGGLGGYDAASSALAPLAMLQGLGQGLANVLVPLRWSGRPDATVVPTAVWLVGAALPVAIALLLGVGKAPRLAKGALAAFLLALPPIASFLPAADNPQTLRLYYLPTVALTGLLAAGGRLPALAVLVAFAWPFVAMRQTQRHADATTAAMHHALLREATDGADDPMFVAGLPHVNASGTVVQLHFGVDRLLQPPFTAQPRRLFALRPLAEVPGVFTLTAPGEVPFALPAGSTWSFADASALVQVPPGATLPDLPITGDVAGLVDLTTPQLESLEPLDAPKLALRTPGLRPLVFRATLFTASGYVATVFFDHAADGAADGEMNLRRWFAGDPRQGDDLRKEPARFGFASGAYVGEALPIPTTLDLVPEFPLLLEAGGLDAERQFVPTHRARRLLTMRFDRDYPRWMRRVQGR